MRFSLSVPGALAGEESDHLVQLVQRQTQTCPDAPRSRGAQQGAERQLSALLNLQPSQNNHICYLLSELMDPLN